MSNVTNVKNLRKIQKLLTPLLSRRCPQCFQDAQDESRRRRQHYSTGRSEYDVIISGGGMVGTAMAAALGHESMLEDKKVLLLEAGSPQILEHPPANYSSRVCALSPATVKLLNSFGAWKNIQDMRCQEVKRMQVWESCSNSMITFNQDDLNDSLAYIVENDIILSGIARQVAEVKDKVEIRYNAKVKSYTLPTSGEEPGEGKDSHLARVELDSGEQLSARLLIGADGFKSLLRETADISTLKWEYDQFGVVAALKLAEDVENNVAWQRFLTSGPIALLPLSSDYSCLIWTTTPENANNLLRLTEDSFVDAVNDAFWSNDSKDPIADYASQTLDRILTTVGLDGSSSQQLPPTVLGVDAGSRAMFPLGLCHANHYVGQRMALIGDAAHRIHPLAGQGVNLGFGDVSCLLEQLTKAAYNGEDIGSIGHLLEYETARQRHVLPTMFTMDGLVRLYGTSWTPIVALRTVGLQTCNALKPLKAMLMSHATS